jgi:hypothetical protein
MLLTVLTAIAGLGQAPAPAARDGMITGQVVDAASGKPVSSAIVSLAGAGVPLQLPSAPSTGFRLLSGVPRILTGTDGRFVFRDLPDGNFTVLATKGGYADGESGRRVIAGPSQPVVLSDAQRTADVAVRIWKNGAITGTIVDEAGEAVVGVQVRASRRTYAGGRRRFTVMGPSASFTFAAVPPGLYSLRATTRVGAAGSTPGSDMFWIDMPITISGDDVDGVVAAMRPALRITGRSETPFEFNHDVSDLVLTFTDRWSGISGVVQGTGAGGAMILAFTTTAQAWENAGSSPRRLKSTRANARGEFGLSSVPSGDYYVIAVPEEQASDWRDPKTLDALARQATQVSIGEGEHKRIDLQIKEVRQ